MEKNQSKKRILLGVTASIAAYKACDLVKELRRAGFDVTVALTKDAHHFITPLSLQTFSGNEVLTDFFGPQAKPVHIQAARESDLVVVAPATADFIAKIAHGLADDLLTCVILATPAPILVAPAMNDRMWLNAFTQENVIRLKQHGIGIIEPIKGSLACGYEAEGHLADNSKILEAIQARL